MGQLPIKYLGVPLTSKRLNIKHYLPLIDKIIGTVRHSSSRLLSYVGKIQLVHTIAFTISQYWMQCLPLSKFVIQNINNVCRSFIWTEGHEVKRKSLVVWKTICSSISQWGLNITNSEIWNQVAMLKCLWNIGKKSDNL